VRFLIKLLSLTFLSAILASCSSLPAPIANPAEESQFDPDALALLRASSQKSGNPWQKLRRVSVQYDGEWTAIAKRVQPILVDAGFRKSSTETYFPREGKVIQIHRGPDGEKSVTRLPGSIKVQRNGAPDTEAEPSAAAALVADAYTVFTFGSSVLLDRGSGWRVLGQRELAGERCTLISGTMSPGFGISKSDGVIAWIGDRSKHLLRIQLTLEGLESTAGADVDVTFGDFQPGPHGTEWPRHFVERVRRPFDVKAHEWRMISLKVSR
jgi:hypothetical protein